MKRKPLIVGWLLVAMWSACPVAVVGQPSTLDCSTRRPVPPFAANAEQVAGRIGVLPLVQRLRVLATQCSTVGVFSVEELTLHQQIGDAE